MTSDNFQTIASTTTYTPPKLNHDDFVKTLSNAFRFDSIFKVDYTPKRILKSNNATIVFWKDGTKTIVKRSEDEEESDYAAFTAALSIKVFGSNSALKRIVGRTERQQKKKKDCISAEAEDRKAMDEWFDTIEKRQK